MEVQAVPLSSAYWRRSPKGADRRTDKMIDFFRCFLTHHQPVVHNVQHNNTAVVQHVNNGSAVNSAEDS